MQVMHRYHRNHRTPKITGTRLLKHEPSRVASPLFWAFLENRRSRMEITRGIAVSPGVAIGPALVLDTERFRIPQRYVDTDLLGAETARLRAALKAAADEARSNQDAVSEKLGGQYGAIFAAHVHLIEDPGLASEIEKLIIDHGFAAEI